jgi:hypothetical protein
LKRPAAVVSCGELPMAVPADWKGTLSFPAPTKAASAILRLDGKEVGSFAPVAKDKKPNWPDGIWLLDTSGKKTYQGREIVYRPADVVPGDEKTKTRPAEPPPPFKLQAKFLHTLPRWPDHFLELAPQLAFTTLGNKLELLCIDDGQPR